MLCVELLQYEKKFLMKGVTHSRHRETTNTQYRRRQPDYLVVDVIQTDIPLPDRMIDMAIVQLSQGPLRYTKNRNMHYER